MTLEQFLKKYPTTISDGGLISLKGLSTTMLEFDLLDKMTGTNSKLELLKDYNSIVTSESRDKVIDNLLKLL